MPRDLHREPGQTLAISDTGPLISVFQSESLSLLCQLFGYVIMPEACRAEVRSHGWGAEFEEASPCLVATELDDEEQAAALEVATAVARHPVTKDRAPESHLGEAQAIVLALRPEHTDDVLLLDERAAREIAKSRGARLSGFPGVLILAAQVGLIPAEDVKRRLESCRDQGTHYGAQLIEEVFEIATRGGAR